MPERCPDCERELTPTGQHGTHAFVGLCGARGEECLDCLLDCQRATIARLTRRVAKEDAALLERLAKSENDEQDP